MSEISARIAALSPNKRRLLESLRGRKGPQQMPARPSDPTGGVPFTPPGRPFSMLSSDDRRALPADVEDAYPLSMMQAGMIYHMELTPDYLLYHNVDSTRLQMRFVREPFQEAVQRVVARHPILRTSFDLTRYSEPLQLVHKDAFLPIQVEDIRHLSFERQEEVINECMESEKRHRFDLSRPPLLRLHVHLRTDDTVQTTITEFHPILDGWSLNLTIAEIFKHYFALLRNEPLPAEPPPSMTFRDFVFLERRAMESPEAEQYWGRKLSDCNVPELPRWPLPSAADEARPVCTLHVPVEARVFGSLKRLARSAAVPLKTVLLSAHLKVMSVLSGQRHVLTGLTTHGRPEGVDGDQVRGVFFNTVPFSVKLSPGTWADLVRETFKAECELLPFRRYPLAALQRQRGKKILLETGFNITHYHLYERLYEESSLSEVKPFGDAPKALEENEFPLYATFHIDFSTSALRLMLECHLNRLCREQIATIVECYTRVLSLMADAPDSSHDAAPLLSASERALIAEWNDTARDYSTSTCLHQLVERQAHLAPEAVAVSAARGQITYGQLDERASSLARRLRASGIGPDAPVAVMLDRSPEMVVALLAVLKAGGAYLPLDPAYPQERLAFMLRDAGARLLLTTPELAPRAGSHGARVIFLGRHADDAAARDEALSADGAGRRAEGASGDASPENLAYVIYTSGSTGTPKGVGVTHRALVNFLCSMREEPGLSAEDVLLAVTTLGFDIAGLELWLPLMVGARVELATREEAADGLRLLKRLEDSAATVMQATPATWRLLLQAGWGGGGRLKVLCGGEALPPELAEELTRRSPSVWNMYGPTETTIWSAVQRVRGGEPVRIGRGIGRTRLYVLDEQHQLAPLGAVGEICIGGEGVARGYLGRPGLTAERFVPDAWSGESGGRVYRTGDMGRYSAGGEIEYLGRRDGQVKVRGHRIELGEIEAALAQHEAVRQAVVVAREEQAHDKRLVAYLIPEPGQTPAASELRAHLREKLPEYMLPSAFVSMEEFPLTPNGKINRSALPAPSDAVTDDEGKYTPPQTPLQEIVASIWGEILGVKRLDIHDNFFDLGGHSLLATQLILRLRKAFDLELPLQTLFESPTIEGLALSIEAATGRGEGPRRPPLDLVPREQALPLSFNQEQLWILDQLNPGAAAYNIPTAIRLTGKLDVPALERAVSEIVRRHEVLRTTFAVAGDRPTQVIAAPRAVSLPVTDLRRLPAEEREREAQRLAAEEAARPFDLARGPLFRFALLRTGEEDYVLTLTMHHIVSDAWSMNLLVGEVGALYEAYFKGEESPLEELPVQYADFAAWQRQWLTGEALEEQHSYWRKQLAGISGVAKLPTDRPRRSEGSYRGALYGFELPQTLADALRELGRKQGVTMFMLLLTVFKVLLRVYTREEEVVVGTPVAARNQMELESLIGFFANTLVLRTDVPEDATVEELFKRVREVCLGAYAHQEMPFEELVRELQPERGLGRTPLFQVAFTLQNAPSKKLELDGLILRPVQVESGRTPFDLILSVNERAQGLGCAFEYNEELFDAARIRRMAAHFEVLLSTIAHHPEARVRECAGIVTQWDRGQQAALEAQYQKARVMKFKQVKRKPVGNGPAVAEDKL